MSNSVKMTELLHKNTNACNNCFQSLQQLELIILRQLTVFIDSKKDISEYSDRNLKTTFDICLKEKNLLGIKEVINANFSLCIGNNTFNIEKQQGIESIIKNSGISKNEHIARIKDLFEFLSETIALRKILDKISVILTTLSWVPIITGELDLRKFCEYLKNLSTKSKIKLNTSTVNLTEKEKVRLVTFSSNSAGDINLDKGFETATNQLDAISDPHVIAQLLEIIKLTTNDLVSLQDKLGIKVISESLQKLYQKEDSKDSQISIRTSSESAVTHDKSSEFNQYNNNSNLNKQNFDKTQPNNGEKNITLSNSVGKATEIHSLNNKVESENKNELVIKNNPKACHIQDHNEKLVNENTYVIRKINTNWLIEFYIKPTSKPKIIKLEEIPGLGKILNDANFSSLNIDKLNIEKTISGYHIFCQLKYFSAIKQYEEGLVYINKYQTVINQSTWLNLNKFSSLCKATFHCELVIIETEKLLKECTGETLNNIRSQAGDLRTKQKKLNSELVAMMDYVMSSNMENANNNCTIF